MVAGDPPLMRLLRAIAAGNMTNVLRMLAASPSLAAAQLERGATRQAATDYFLDEINRYVYVGDSTLHVAAASYFRRSCANSSPRAPMSTRRIAMAPDRCTTRPTVRQAQPVGIRTPKLRRSRC
jgi:hypothetical protein